MDEMHMTSRVRRSIAMVCLAAGVFGQAPLVAQQTGSKTANLKVTSEVVANCVISLTDLAFGRYDPVVANATVPLDAEATLNLKCTAGTSPKTSFDIGQNASGSSRQMASGANRLAYQLFSDAARSSLIEAQSFTSTFQDSVTRHIPVYGRIPQGQGVEVGTYQDTVLVTVVF